LFKPLRVEHQLAVALGAPADMLIGIAIALATTSATTTAMSSNCFGAR
jgi:hypothetical protein